MPKVKRVCRVCGKEFESCRQSKGSGVYSWREVACSLECAAEWFRRVDESRNPQQFAADEAEAAVTEEVVEEVIEESMDEVVEDEDAITDEPEFPSEDDFDEEDFDELEDEELE